MNNHLTQHAHERMAQRAVRPNTLQLFLTFADRRIHLGDGCAVLAISHDRVEALREAGLSDAIVSRAAKISVVVDALSNDIVTVLNAPLRPSYRAGRHRHHRGGKRDVRAGRH